MSKSVQVVCVLPCSLTQHILTVVFLLHLEVLTHSQFGYDAELKLMGLCTLEEERLMGNAASEGGIAYVTGTADLAEGKEAEARDGSSELSTGTTHSSVCSSKGRLWGFGYLWEGSE